METVIHLDTHVAVWLYAGDRRRLKTVWKNLEKSDLMISPVVMLELQYLHEVGRTAEPAESVVADLVERIGLRISDAPMSRVVSHALRLTWTRDPFDRLIVGTALVDNCPLVTKDSRILRHCHLAQWG